MIPRFKTLIAPAAALALCGWWIAGQRQTLATVEAENQAWSERIARVHGGTADHGNFDDPSVAARLHSQSQRGGARKADWKSIAARIRLRSGDGVQDMHAMIGLQRILRGLSATELASGLEEVGRMNLDDAERRELESTILGILVQKDPRLALETFAARVNDDRNGISWILASGFRDWCEKDPLPAIEWLDQRIAEGLFDSKALDGRCPSRLRFEASLIGNLVHSDPAAAATRLANIPESQRSGVFSQGMFLNIKPGKGRAIADLIRNGLPEELGLATLANAFGPLARHQGLAKAGELLGEIRPSDRERAEVVREAVKHALQGNPASGPGIGEIRNWIVAQAPRDAERLSGQMLAEMVQTRGFAEMAALALEYRDHSGSDDALVAFLERAPDTSRFEIMELAEQIRDPDKRYEVTRRFLNNPNRQSTPAAP